MTTNVKGAGRAKYLANKKHQQRTPLPPRTTRQKSPAELEAERAEERAELTATPAEKRPGMKARAFAQQVEDAGWTVSRRIEGDVRTVMALRHHEGQKEILELAWDGEVRVLPFLHKVGDVTKEFTNVTVAIKLLAIPADVAAAHVSRARPGKEPSKNVSTAGLDTRPRFSPKEAPDDEVMLHIAGHKLKWRNQFTEVEEEGLVPIRGTHTRLDADDLDDMGTRQLTFCDAEGAGYRTLRLKDITSVSLEVIVPRDYEEQPKKGKK
jgi:hypothetical protein